MNIRTYEIIAKWIGKKTGVHIKFEPDATPNVVLETKTITLPSNIKDKGIFGALACLIHEAAHLWKTTQIPIKDLAKDYTDHYLLNAMEDVRINHIMFKFLPNIRSFYSQLYKSLKLEDYKEQTMSQKIIFNALLQLEGFSEYEIKDKRIDDELFKTQPTTGSSIYNHFSRGINFIRHGDWKGTRDEILKLKDLLFKDQPPPFVMLPTLSKEDKEKIAKEIEAQVKAQAQAEKEGKDKGQGQGKGKEEQKGKGQGEGGSEKQGKGDKNKGVDIVTGRSWSKESFELTNNQSQGTSEIGKAVLEEITKQRLKEALNIQSIRYTDDGNILNEDSLISFFEGDIDELFIDDKVEKHRLSRIIFLLDSSGSMKAQLMDNTSRCHTLARAVKSITNIIDEVKETEGLAVDYEVRSFNNYYRKLDKDRWQQQYLSNIGGGTTIDTTFQEAVQEILSDPLADGKKLIVFVTDGEVHDREVDTVKRIIMKNGGEVRCMILGIDARLDGKFVQEIAGDHNIIAEEHADEIIHSAIQTMLT